MSELDDKVAAARAEYERVKAEYDAINRRLVELAAVRLEIDDLDQRLMPFMAGRSPLVIARVELQKALLERELARAVDEAPAIPLSAVATTDRDVDERYWR